MDFTERITEAASRIREIPGQLENVRDSMCRKCEACIAGIGARFEQLLLIVTFLFSFSASITFFVK